MIDKTICAFAVNNFGENAQMIVAIEECSELQKEITKIIRNKGNLENLAEEIADVEIMIEQLKYMYKLYNQVSVHKREKIKRLEKILIDKFDIYKGQFEKMQTSSDIPEFIKVQVMHAEKLENLIKSTGV